MRPNLAGLALAGVLTLTAAGAVAQAEAERQLDAALDRLRAVLGPETTLAWGSRRINPVTGRARLGEIVMTKGEQRLTVAEVLLQDISETLVGRAEFTAIRMTESKAQNAELARLVIGGLPLPAPGATFEFATFRIALLQAEGLRATTPDGDLSLGRLNAENYAPGSLANAVVEGAEYRGPGANPNGFRLGRVSVTGLTMPKPGDDLDPRAFTVQDFALEGGSLQDPDKEVSLQLGRAALRDWVPGRLANLAVEGLTVGAPFGDFGPGEVRVGRLAASGIDFPSTITAIMENKAAPNATPGNPQLIALEGVTAQANGQALFTLGRLAVDGTADTAGLLTASLVLEGLRASLPPGTGDWFAQAGYREIAGGLELRASQNTTTGRFAVEPLRLSWEQAGILGLEAAAENFPSPLTAGASLPDDYADQLLSARLASLTLRYRDQGLLGRAIAQQARAQRVPEDRIRNQWAQMALAMPMPGSPPPRRGPAQPAVKGQPAQAAAPDEFAQMRQALADFIRQPREIEFALRPAKPVAFRDMAGFGAAGPAEAMRALGLTVRLP